MNLKTSALVALPMLAAAVAGCNSNSTGGGSAASSGGGSTDAASLDTSATIAKVGSEEITRGEVFSFLEGGLGRDAVTQLVDFHLVMQDAKSKGVDITDKQVDDEIARRAETTPALAEAVKAGGLRLDSVKRQVRYQLALDGVLTQSVKADPKAVEAWLNTADPAAAGQKTRARYDKAAQVKLGILLSSQKARADIMASQLKGGKSFADLVKEQKAKKANDPAAVGSTASTADAAEGAPEAPNGGYLPFPSLPAPLKAALTSLKVNQTSPVVAISPAAGKAPGLYAIVQLLDRKPEVKASATDPTVVMDYKMTQVALKVIKDLSTTQPSAQKLTLTQAVQSIIQSAQQKAMQAMQQGNFSQQTVPTYRDAIDQINRSESNKILAALRTKAGNVTFVDKEYTSLADSYKPVPTPAPLPGAGGAASGGAPSTAPAGNSASAPAASPAADAAGAANSAAPAANSAAR